MGSDPLALPVLELLAKCDGKLDFKAIYTQPDRPRGRGKKVQPNEIKSWAQEREIAVYQPEAFTEEATRQLSEMQPDIILVMAYGHLLPQTVIDVAPLGIYNLHTSLLPKLRGASPIETAVSLGLEQSGVTLMELVIKMDAGPVCDQEPVTIDTLETGGSYREKLAAASRVLLERNLSSLLGGSASAVPQDENQVTYCRTLVKQDGQLDFSRPAHVLACRINGLNPWPGCHSPFGEVNLKIGLADWFPAPGSFEPGQVVAVQDDGLVVGTGEGLVKFLRIQKPGGKMLPVAEFLRGFPIEPGDRFQSREMHELEYSQPVSRKRVFQLYTKP
ncbi:MAG: methionyl-tRNA formyltransferase [Verrucomicrobiae bacterium]|nr:methionyl-tRNA formyltransferase [Verrucomicrobiae bacterium]